MTHERVYTGLYFGPQARCPGCSVESPCRHERCAPNEDGAAAASRPGHVNAPKNCLERAGYFSPVALVMPNPMAHTATDTARSWRPKVSAWSAVIPISCHFAVVSLVIPNSVM